MQVKKQTFVIAALTVSVASAMADWIEGSYLHQNIIFPATGKPLDMLALNNVGDVVGVTKNPQGTRFVSYRRLHDANSQSMSGYVGRDMTFVKCLNDRHDAAGYDTAAMGRDERAFYCYNGLMVRYLPLGYTARPTAMNNNRRIVGHRIIGNERVGLDWIWDASTQTYNVYTMRLGTMTVPNDIDNYNRIVGTYHRSGQNPKGFIYDPHHINGAQYIDLEAYKDWQNQAIPCGANAISDNGWIAGNGLDPTGRQRAILWDYTTGEWKDIGSGSATDVNRYGIVIGEDQGKAWIWHRTLGRAWITDLMPASSRVPVSRAHKINERNELIVTASFGGGDRQILLSPPALVQGVVLEGSKIKVRTRRDFPPDWLDQTNIRFRITTPEGEIVRTIGGVDNVGPNADVTDTSPEVFDLTELQIPKFKTDVVIKVQVEALRREKTVGYPDAFEKPVLLPVMLVPGIDPTTPNPPSGDGLWPDLERFLMLQSVEKLIDKGYVRGAASSGYTMTGGYRTLYNLIYDRNNAEFSEGSRDMYIQWNAIKPRVHAAKFKIVAHSKGTLVSRYFTFRYSNDVDTLVMANGPHSGSMAAMASTVVYNQSNLWPIYAWYGMPGVGYTTPAGMGNPSLTALAQEVLPLGPKLGIYYANHLPTLRSVRLRWIRVGSVGTFVQIPELGWGDAIVPDFSQRGETINLNTGQIAPLKAFQLNVPTIEPPISYWHSPFIQSPPFMRSLLDKYLVDVD